MGRMGIRCWKEMNRKKKKEMEGPRFTKGCRANKEKKAEEYAVFYSKKTLC